MRLFLTIALLLNIAILGFSQSKKQLKLEALERRRFEAMTTQNVAQLEGMLDEQLTYLHSNGLLENRQQHLENIGSRKLVYRTMQPESMSVRVHGRSAIITGVLHVTGTLGEKTFDLRLRYTDVYWKKRGKWRLAAWQSLKLEEPKK